MQTLEKGVRSLSLSHALMPTFFLSLFHTYCTLYLPEGESALFFWISVLARDPSHAPHALMNISK